MATSSRRARARRSALRAARVVTLAASIAAGPACSERVSSSSDAAVADALVTDAGSVDATDDAGEWDAGGADGGPEGDGSMFADAGHADAGHADAGGDAGHDGAPADAEVDGAVVADASFDAGCEDFPPTTEACCDATEGGFWDSARGVCAVAVPGPFVPPRMV